MWRSLNQRGATRTGWVVRSALAGAASIASAFGSADAAVVVHDNSDGTFQWLRTIVLSGEDPLYGTFLDIRQPPTQSGERKPGTFGSYFYVSVGASGPGIFEIAREGSVQVAWNEDYIKYTWNGESISTIPVRSYTAAEFVESSADWNDFGMHYWALPFSFEFAGGTPLIESLAYLGVRIKTGTNKYNYGWILFKDWTHPVMWAYETEPNTPIQIPVPAPMSLSLFAVGFFGRRDSMRGMTRRASSRGDRSWKCKARGGAAGLARTLRLSTAVPTVPRIGTPEDSGRTRFTPVWRAPCRATRLLASDRLRVGSGHFFLSVIFTLATSPGLAMTFSSPRPTSFLAAWTR